MFESNNNRCAHCKFSYYSGETMTHTVLPPVLKCGKLDIPCKDGVCQYFEPKLNNGFPFENGYNWRVTS